MISQDSLRLEVETTPTGLVNLVKNPSGEKGTSGWLSPVANTTLDSDGVKITAETTATQATFYTTEFLPATASMWYGARLNYAGGNNVNNYIRVRFEWYNASKVLLSSGTQSASRSTTTQGVVYLPGTQAPVNTAYMKLRIDNYTGTGTSNATAGYTFNFKMAMVTEAATSAGLGLVRKNLVPNPSFEVNTTGWFAVSGTTLSRVTTEHDQGAAALRALLGNNTGHVQVFPSASYFPLTAGKDYVASLRVKASSASAQTLNFYVDFYNASGGYVRSTVAAPLTLSTSWQTVWLTFTVQSGITAGGFTIDVTGVPNGASVYMDSFMVEEGFTLGTYFDGSLTDTADTDYAWTGTAHNSASTATTSSNYDFVEPYQWMNILGPVHEVRLNREALNAGLLSAEIHDPDLDPSVAPDIRPGRQLRMRVMDSDTSEWTSLYEGVITNGHVTYPPSGAVIAITAADNAQRLANIKQPVGVGTVPHLAGILEGNGVPWKLNGSSVQTSSWTKVAQNDNASLLDQVAVTRDSVLGYAWVDRTNILNVNDAGSMPGTPVATVDEDYYSDADVDFNTDLLINNVTVKFLRWKSGGETKEIIYGPYKDQASIDTWGSYSAEFTIQSATESKATIDAYAASILAANSTPVIRVNSVEVPIKAETDLTTAKALLDLYDLVNVNYDTASFNEDMRITSVEHVITPDRWTMTLGFDTEGGVAMPQVTPSPIGAEGIGLPPFASRYAGANVSRLNNTDFTQPFGGENETTSVTYANPNFTITRPGIYHIEAQLEFAANATAKRTVSIQVNATNVANTTVGASPNGPTTVRATKTVRLAVGDVISVVGNQNSGGALDVNNGNAQTFITITWLGD